MPVIIEAFDSYPDIDGLTTDLNKLYGEALTVDIIRQCELPETRLYCGKFNGRWITAALITTTPTDSGEHLTLRYAYVREATRRRGVGTQLIKEIINQEYAMKSDNITLCAHMTPHSAENLQVAEAFLSALGFEPDTAHTQESQRFIYRTAAGS